MKLENLIGHERITCKKLMCAERGYHHRCYYQDPITCRKYHNYLVKKEKANEIQKHN